MSLLHFSQTIVIPGLNPISFISPSNRALQVILGLPLPLLPTTSKFLHALTQLSTSFRSTCPNHLNLPRLITSTTPSTPSLLLSSTVETLSLNVTPTSILTLHSHFSAFSVLPRPLLTMSHWHTPLHFAHVLYTLPFCFKNMPLLVSNNANTLNCSHAVSY